MGATEPHTADDASTVGVDETRYGHTSEPLCRTITVSDTTIPVVAVEADVTIEASEYNGEDIDGSCSDTCDGDFPAELWSVTSETIGLQVGAGFDGDHITQWLVSSDYFGGNDICGVTVDDRDGAYSVSDASTSWSLYHFNGQANTGCAGSCNGGTGLDFGSHYQGRCDPGHLSNVNAYAKTHIYSQYPQTVNLQWGADDGIIVWVNGQKVVEELNNCRCYSDNFANVDINLNAGFNRIVVKVGENGGHFGFVMEIADAYAHELHAAIEEVEVSSFFYCGGTPQDASDAADAFANSRDAAALAEQCGCYDLEWGCEDDARNTASLIQRVCVSDTTPPVIEIEEGYTNFLAIAKTSSGAASFVFAEALVGALVAHIGGRSKHSDYETL